MTALDADEFEPFFEAVWGTRPFRWQIRLTHQVLRYGRWPEVIDLPTGSGKTSTLDIALFALACQPSVFPRRVVFVVDRRIIVDQVGQRAQHLADELTPEREGVVGRVAERLASLSGNEAGRPALAVLRGGTTIANDWAERPDRPAVLVSTVDQFGSRLLFSGYGVRDTMQPVHAGLCGNDTLILLDEVQLARPFAKTLRAISGRYRPCAGPLPDRWQVVEMSATPGESAEVPFGLIEEDLDAGPDDPLVERVGARKEARLRSIGDRREDAGSALAREVPRLLDELPPTAATIGVVVNRVASARAIADALRRRNVPVDLLTGRMRPIDRDRVLSRITDAVDPDRNGPAERHVVVATQCIEVGADFSFDALLTEVAPLDSLRQRFGRLDRRGTAAKRGTPAPALVLGVSSVVGAESDPVYGEALALTWRTLTERFGERTFDVGPRSADLARLGAGLEAPAPVAPLLLPSHLDALVQTKPRPAAGPDVAHFLHGFVEPDVDVSIVWRADIPAPATPDLPGQRDLVAAILQIFPPRPAEAMPVPIAAARRWLRDGQETIVADVEQILEPDDRRVGAERRRAWRWRGLDDVEPVADGDLSPGDTLIVPAAYGGVTLHSWDPAGTEPVPDLGDQASYDAPSSVGRRAQPTLRLHPNVLPPGLPKPPTPTDLDDDDPDETVVAAWREHARDGERPRWLLEALAWPRVERYQAVGSNGVEWFFVLRGAGAGVDVATLDGSDEANSFAVPSAVTLEDHLAGVADTARRFAERCGLSGELAADFELAGRVHDLGKADARFQRQLHRSELSYLQSAAPLAKSPRRMSRSERELARRASGYPRGMRHELLSVAMVADTTIISDAAHDPDLVLHLVASHHGYSRPLPELVVDGDPCEVTATVGAHRFKAWSAPEPPHVGIVQAERFWRLVERYGSFGLAWLEAIFRLADHRRSEVEAKHDG